ncbi:transcriptional repressor AgaR [uncultured Paludibaculum sp.]|uniref:transcriptional repressor AgaR n=1 Tax=uncultured Paludibaculum sp. TaxID=1765020 RepID=UPI002AAAB9A5|nr:transcriptional repressor AgaR [uncultured Paludibaculum sp.]
MSDEAPTRGARLLTEERRRKILELVEMENRVTVEGLVRRFAVSSVTIRADLDSLAKAGSLIRSHGGAIKCIDPRADYPIAFKEALHHAEKARIGHAAAELIRPGQIIILDSGTTTAEIARRLKHLRLRPITVITNALNSAMELSSTPDLSVVMLGGILRPMSFSLVGPQAEQTLRNLNADQLFLGVDALDPELGLSTPDILEAQLNALMIKVAKEVTVVADSSKLGRRSLSVICKTNAIHRLITDTGADGQIVEALREQGVVVQMV